MKKHEIDAKIAALTKQIEELKAMPVEPDQPLCVMPGRMERHGKHWFVYYTGRAESGSDDRLACDNSCFETGNYFSSERQASADAHAVSVMRLMRRMPGVVGADADCMKWRPEVWSGNMTISAMGTVVPTDSYCMFPCYATEAQARAAIESVGGEDALRRCAEYWSGVMK